MSEEKYICWKCGKPAVWCYVPGKGDPEDYCCDDCVPRGCSCNDVLKEGIDIDSPEAELPENYVHPLDEKGREFPCCEWWNC